jgi:hypothetical protein
MNAGLLLIIALGCAALLWFVWLGYSDHRKLRRQLLGANRARQTTTVSDVTDSANRRTNS